MPLVPCPDCHRQISDAAPACIHCGRPNPLAVHPTPRPSSGVPRPGTRRHPLAGTDRTAAPPATRAVLRGVVVALVIMLIIVTWFRGDGAAGTDDLLHGLISAGIGVSLLLSPVPPPSGRTPGARRGNWGDWFGGQEARHEFRWNRVAGWVCLVVSAFYLLLAAL